MAANTQTAAADDKKEEAKEEKKEESEEESDDDMGMGKPRPLTVYMCSLWCCSLIFFFRSFRRFWLMPQKFFELNYLSFNDLQEFKK